ncbi:MAG: outer membrane beta-barrel protein [Xanthobacteraceae bacterium]
MLRGSEPVGLASYTNWSGVYLGGQWGYSDASADFSNATQAPIAYVLRDSGLEDTSDPSKLTALGTDDHTAMSYGGFVGYNSQWQNLILGVEGDFVHTNVALTAPSSPIARNGLSDGAGNTYAVSISANGTMTNLDYAELRGRAGLILGNFLPYGYLGAVIGVANVNVNANVTGICQSGSSCSDFSFNASSGRNSALLYGGAVGAGLDYAITQHIFLRGEFEYLRFAPCEDVIIAVSSVRIGAGVKF